MARRARGLDRAGFVDRLADDVHDAAERFVADRHRDRRAGVVDSLAAHQTFGRCPWRCVRTVFSPRCCATSSTRRLPPFIGLQRVQDLRQVPVELHVDDGADDLGDLAGLALAAIFAGVAFTARSLPELPWPAAAFVAPEPLAAVAVLGYAAFAICLAILP